MTTLDLSLEEVLKGWRLVSEDRYPEIAWRSMAGLAPHVYEYLRVVPLRDVVGADEVGRGALAGPVVVAAFVSPVWWNLCGLRDSKNLTPKVRSVFADAMHRMGRYAVRFRGPEEVEEHGINLATQRALEGCMEEIAAYRRGFDAAIVVTDEGLRTSVVDHAMFPKADDIVPHVSAASVIAKVARDRYMAQEAHELYPAYGFDRNVGYGTAQHFKALREHGPCPLHRSSFLTKVLKEQAR